MTSLCFRGTQSWVRIEKSELYSQIHRHTPPSHTLLSHSRAGTSPQVYGIRTRARAVEIFTACAHMICNMEELEKVSGPWARRRCCALGLLGMPSVAGTAVTSGLHIDQCSGARSIWGTLSSCRVHLLYPFPTCHPRTWLKARAETVILG